METGGCLTAAVSALVGKNAWENLADQEECMICEPLLLGVMLVDFFDSFEESVSVVCVEAAEECGQSDVKLWNKNGY